VATRTGLTDQTGTCQSGSGHHQLLRRNKCVQRGQELQIALGLLIRLAHTRVEADTISYSAAVSASKEGQEWQLALGLLVRLAHARVEADAISFSAAVSASKGDKSGNSHWAY
jgi:hypothetical protein